MSGTHGVFQHRTGYFYTILEEDFCEIYKAEGVNEVCRAYITSILENLTNKQFDENSHNEDIWVFMSLPEMARRMRNAYSERTIHKEIQGMIKDGYLKKRRAEHKATMEYCLNLKKIRDGLSSLPEKQSCNSATSHLANLQDQSGKIARLTLQNCKKDLAELQPRISNRLNKEETKEEESIASEVSATQPLAPNVALSPTSQTSLSVSSSKQAQEEVFPIDEMATRNTQFVEQKPLIAVDKSIPPVMPHETAIWCAETVVQIVEARLHRRFLEDARGKSQKSQRERQLEAGKKIIAAKVTRDEFTRAYDNRNDQWWNEKNGELTVVEMAANTHNRVMRTLEVLENIEKKKPTGGRVIDISSKTPTERPAFLVSEEKRQRNLERLRQRSAASGNE